MFCDQAHLASLFSCDIINAILLKVFSFVYGSSFNASQSLTTAQVLQDEIMQRNARRAQDHKLVHVQCTCTVGI